MELQSQMEKNREEAHKQMILKYEGTLAKYKTELHAHMHQDRVWMMIAFFIIIALFIF
jgi:hypothetical protein